MADTVERVKEKLTIVEVVAPYVKLTKAGRYHKGLSPFNKEKTPSFYINVDRGTYYCFSSGQGGDMFTFIEKMEGVDFKGALKILAEKAGVPLEYSGHNKDQNGKTDRLREAVSRAEAFYARNLDEKGDAYQYALSRGLTPETIRAWNLGLAPDGWRTLLEELSTAGFTIPELLAAGLIKEADGKPGTYYDRFRNRLMFPIKDGAGRTVAFTGRALTKDDPAKYLNSPETELFKKSQVLFGMDRSKDAIRSRGFALLVEGQFDLILLHQIGFTNTIALSGTALSSEHLTLIKRYADNLMLALDSDRAGLAASAKNAHAALAAGMRVKAVRMPLGKDPADLASETPQVLSASEKDQHRLVIAVERVVLPLIAIMRSPMEREHFIGVIARNIGSSIEAVRSSVPKAGAVPNDVAQEVVFSGKAKEASPEEARGLLIIAATQIYPETPLAKRLIDEYARIIGSRPQEEPLPERALFEAGLLFGESPHEHSGDDLVRAFERTVLTDRLHDATARLRQAESAKDDAAMRQALADCKDLGTRLATLG
jgi:DNA primase catalytic core